MGPLICYNEINHYMEEDVGMADSRALQIAVAAYQACQFLGMPECNVHLTHAVVFCSLAPKSNALEVAYMTAAEDAKTMLDEPVPLQIRNAPTKLMSELGYGKDYMYKKVTIKKEDLLNYEFFSDYRSAYFFYLKKYFMQK